MITLGQVAVAIIILAVTIGLLFSLDYAATDTSATDWTGWIVIVILVISMYCAISGTYLLHLWGKV